MVQTIQYYAESYVEREIDKKTVLTPITSMTAIIPVGGKIPEHVQMFPKDPVLYEKYKETADKDYLEFYKKVMADIEGTANEVKNE